MVYVCDAIMGSGKSQSAITYMNEHPDQKFIYITPYLDEAARIKRDCPKLRFIEPSSKIQEYAFKKHLHTAALIKEGRNIATTHQSFVSYTPDMLEDVYQLGYTLIIDENVTVLERYQANSEDIRGLVELGYIKDEDGAYSKTDKLYGGTAHRSLFIMLQSRKLYHITSGDDEVLFFWMLPPELLLSFKDVYILTYLFEGQSLHYFMKMYGIQYRNIGVEVTSCGNGYRFSEETDVRIPEYVKDLKSMIHIVENKKLNSVGDGAYALSMNWYKSGANKDKVEQVKRNLFNLFHNIWKDVPAERRMWGAYKGEQNRLKGLGYSKAYLNFNARASNEYRDRDHLAYPINVFYNAEDIAFYKARGIDVNTDMYALSTLVQWIWRSAIREGKEIWLYLPSTRMRKLLEDWIKSLSEGGEAGSE